MLERARKRYHPAGRIRQRLTGSFQVLGIYERYVLRFDVTARGNRFRRNIAYRKLAYHIVHSGRETFCIPAARIAFQFVAASRKYAAHKHDASFARQVFPLARSCQAAPCRNVCVKCTSELVAQSAFRRKRTPVGNYYDMPAFKVCFPPGYILHNSVKSCRIGRMEKNIFHTHIIPEF